MSKLRFLLGSTSERKLNTVSSVIESLVDGSYMVDGRDVSSGVPDTPWNEQSKQGATNRAQAIANTDPDCYAIGIESGLVERYGDVYEECWSCVIFADRTYYGYSSGLRLPDYVTQRMTDLGQDHGPTMRQIRQELGIDNDKDTWGLYSNYALQRQVSLEESLRNALIQLFAPDGHLYAHR